MRIIMAKRAVMAATITRVRGPLRPLPDSGQFRRLTLRQLPYGHALPGAPATR